jgi:hypothetical protein
VNRTKDRLIINSKELCNFFSEQGFEAVVESEDHTGNSSTVHVCWIHIYWILDFCHKMATIYSADIIITVDGSHNFMLSFARPGLSLRSSIEELTTEQDQ